MEKKRKWRWGDRGDGWKLKGIDPYDALIPYIMVERNDSQNLYRDRFEIGEAEKYIKQKRAEGYKTFGMLHLLISAYVRTISQKPFLNRFISGQKVYAHKDITINLAVKRQLTLDCTDTVVKMRFEPSDTAYDVYQKINETICAAVASSETSFDGTARIINYIPGLFKKFTIWLLKKLDYFGLLPKALINVSPFHGSMFITNIGSLGIPPIFHHLYNFGNVPVFVGFGSKYSENNIDDTGNPVRNRYIDFTVVTDERICDGYAYSTCLRLFKRFLTNPYVLDVPPETVYEDFDIDRHPINKKAAE